MPKFLDVHTLNRLDEETIRKLQTSPVDEFGIKPLNLMYNQQEDIFYCLLDAPNKQAVENHHNKYGFKCEWITEVRTTAYYSNNLMTGRGHYITSSSEGGQFQKITHGVNKPFLS